MRTELSAKLHEKEIRRVDMYISALFKDKSRSYIQKLVDKWCIAINWKIAWKSDKVRNWDIIKIEFETEKMHLEGEDMDLDIIYENDDFAIINKDPWINVHPVPWEWWNKWTLVNWLINHMNWLSVIGWIERPWIVHRLDKDTSWLMIIAKSDRSMHEIQVKMNKRQVSKKYLTLVIWRIKEKNWYIESYIGRDQQDRKRMTAIDPINPKLAKTKFEVKWFLEDKYTLVEVDLLTWRTHQIRVHFASIWYPLVWDKTYWNKKVNDEFNEKYWLKRQYLHAYKLWFELFWNNYEFIWELKKDLEIIYNKIEKL